MALGWVWHHNRHVTGYEPHPMTLRNLNGILYAAQRGDARRIVELRHAHLDRFLKDGLVRPDCLNTARRTLATLAAQLDLL